jgi:hypothetical protein
VKNASLKENSHQAKGVNCQRKQSAWAHVRCHSYLRRLISITITPEDAIPFGDDEP